MRFIPLVLIIMAGILIAGCITQQTNTSVPETPAIIHTSDATLDTLIKGTEIATLDPARQNLTLSLDPGVYVLAIQAENAIGLDVMLTRPGEKTPVNFENFGTFISEGPVNGSMTIRTTEKGEYVLHAETLPGEHTGEQKWTARLCPLPRDPSLKIPLTFFGNGTMVTPMFALDKGEYQVNRTGNQRNFPLFALCYANGSAMTREFETVHPYFGHAFDDNPNMSTSVSIPESGYYFLTSYAGNPQEWTITIIPSLKASP